MKGSTKGRVFGPVPSRRLGFSLGVDVIPYKTCALDCVYCQLGPSARTTIARRRHVPAAPVVAQIKKVLDKKERIDWITFSGSGEPTLNSDLGGMIRAVKRMTRIPVAVLTGSALLDRPAVRRDLAAADLVVPSLDAGTERAFRRINRPHPSLSLDGITGGIAALSRSLPGRVWLEVMLVKGMNDSEQELKALARRIRSIRPAQVQLTTVARPPAEKGIYPLSRGEMIAARNLLRGIVGEIPVEAVGEFGGKQKYSVGRSSPDAVIAYLWRRPATGRDLSRALGLPSVLVRRTLASLLAAGKVRKGKHGGREYYRTSYF